MIHYGLFLLIVYNCINLATVGVNKPERLNYSAAGIQRKKESARLKTEYGGAKLRSDMKGGIIKRHNAFDHFLLILHILIHDIGGIIRSSKVFNILHPFYMTLFIIMSISELSMAQIMSDNMAVNFFPNQVKTFVNYTNSVIYCLTSLTISLPDSMVCSFSNDNRYFVINKKDSSFPPTDIIDASSQGYAKIIQMSANYSEVSNKVISFSCSASPRHCDEGSKDAKISIINFRYNRTLHCHYICFETSKESELFVHSFFCNIPPNAPTTSDGDIDYQNVMPPSNLICNSSTNISVYESAFGILIARGKFEFILTGNKMEPFILFGNGSQLSNQSKVLLKLANPDGTSYELPPNKSARFSGLKWGQLNKAK